MSTNYGKQIAKNKGAVIATFAVAFLATYAVMGSGGAQNNDLSAAVAGSGTPTIVSARVEEVQGVSRLRMRGTYFSTTNNLITVCRVTTATGNCDSKPNTTMYISNVKAATTTTRVDSIDVVLPTKYSDGSAVVTSAKHRVYVLNNTTKKVSNAVTLASLKPTPVTPSLTTSLNSSLTPPERSIRISTSSGVSKLDMFAFDLKAERADAIITMMWISHDEIGTKMANIVDALHLYDAETGTLLASVDIHDSPAPGASERFSGLNIPIQKDTRKTFIVKADISQNAKNGNSMWVDLRETTRSIEYKGADGVTRQGGSAAMIKGNLQHFFYAVPEWQLLSLPRPEVITEVGSTRATTTAFYKINLKVTANGGTMSKPSISDFVVFFASSTQKTYVVGKNAILASQSGPALTTLDMISPIDSSVGNGGAYTLTLTGALQNRDKSGRPWLPAGNYFMLIGKVSARVGDAQVIQTWDLENLRTQSVFLRN